MQSDQSSTAANMEASTGRDPVMQNSDNSITYSWVLAEAGHWPGMASMADSAVSVVKAVYAV